MSAGTRSACWCSRKHSRNSRRARARVTAGPSFLVVMTAIRECEFSGNSIQLRTSEPTAIRWPVWRSRAKSRRWRIRMARVSRSLGAGTAMRLYRRQARAALLASAQDGGAPAPGGHARAEPKATGPLYYRRLIGAFHLKKSPNSIQITSPREAERRSIPASKIVSMGD